jgi:hypothetical protein
MCNHPFGKKGSEIRDLFPASSRSREFHHAAAVLSPPWHQRAATASAEPCPLPLIPTTCVRSPVGLGTLTPPLVKSNFLWVCFSVIYEVEMRITGLRNFII